MDFSDFTDFLHAAARSIGAEIASPWFYLQLGLLLLGAGLAYASSAALRSRVEMTSLAMGWPAPLRLFVRVLASSAFTAIFALLMGVTRAVMLAITWPSRSYLISVGANLA